MKESIFKKNKDKMRAGTNFTKSEPVSSFSNAHEEEKLLSHAMAELGKLLSGLKAGGFSGEELEITPSTHGDKIAICIKAKAGGRLGFNELNLICRIATDLGLLPRIVEGGVEVLSSMPLLLGSSLYSKTILLLKERIESSFSN